MASSSDSIDTNIVLRIILGDVPRQFQLATNFLNTSSATHYLSDLALSETVYVLSTQYHKTREEIIDLLNFFLARYDGRLKYNRALTSLAFPLYLSRPKLSFADCLLSAEAELSAREPLWTFDTKLARQAENAKLLA